MTPAEQKQHAANFAWDCVKYFLGDELPVGYALTVTFANDADDKHVKVVGMRLNVRDEDQEFQVVPTHKPVHWMKLVDLLEAVKAADRAEREYDEGQERLSESGVAGDDVLLKDDDEFFDDIEEERIR